MPTTTPGRALPVALLTELPDANKLNNDLATALDAVGSVYGGTLATRGAAVATVGTAKGSPGTFYYATDTGQLFLSFAGIWIDLGAGPPIPISAAMDYAGAGDPADTRFLLEDGRLLNSTTDTTLAPLFTLIGTRYGGTGAGAFNLPDSRGRVAISPDNMGTAAGAAGRLPNTSSGLGNAGGEEQHLLTTTEAAQKSVSTGTDTPDHTHSAVGAANNAGGPYLTIGSPVTGSTYTTTGASARHTHSIAGSSAAAAHNNVQPYVVKNKIIRVR